MTSICKHYFVSGTVQGVFYRRHTYEKATELGLTGWVRNTEEGQVEIVICGDPQTLSIIEKWLWEGPTHAQVTSVESREIPYEELQGFQIK